VFYKLREDLLNLIKVTLTNNGLMHLFNSFKLQLSDETIESLNYPGQATAMLGLLKYPTGFTKAQGLNQLGCKDIDDDLIDENQGFSKRQN
jgi:hypothetical protein